MIFKRICNFNDCLDVFKDVARRRGFELNNTDSNLINISFFDYSRRNAIWNESMRVPFDTYASSVHEFLDKLKYMHEDVENSRCPNEVKEVFSKLIETTEIRIADKVKRQNELAIAIQREKERLNSRMSLNESVACNNYINKLIEKFISNASPHVRMLLEEDLLKVEDYFDDIRPTISLAKKDISEDCLEIFKDQHECEDYNISFSKVEFVDDKEDSRIDLTCTITLKDWRSSKLATLTTLKGRVEACLGKCERVFFRYPYICELVTPTDIDFKRWELREIVDWDGKIVIKIHLTADDLANFRGVPVSEVVNL